MTKAERNCSTVEREPLMVVSVVRKFYPYSIFMGFYLFLQRSSYCIIKDFR